MGSPHVGVLDASPLLTAAHPLSSQGGERLIVLAAKEVPDRALGSDRPVDRSFSSRQGLPADGLATQAALPCRRAWPSPHRPGWRWAGDEPPTPPCARSAPRTTAGRRCRPCNVSSIC